MTNLHDVGRTAAPSSLWTRRSRNSSTLSVRGSDIARWRASPSCHVLFVQDPANRAGHQPEADARALSAVLLRSLLGFERELRARAAFRRYFTRRKSRRLARRRNWTVLVNVRCRRIHSRAEHKVVWERSREASDFVAAVMPDATTSPLPNHKLIFVACQDRRRGSLSLRGAQFVALCASSLPAMPSRHRSLPIPSSTSTSRSSIKTEAIHAALAQLPRRRRHTTPSPAGDEPDEQAVDRAAVQLWSLTTEELEAMRVLS